MYNDLRPSGCCTQDSDCSSLAAENNCAASTCDLGINQCSLSSDPSCCYYGAQCPNIADENNACIYDTCSGLPSLSTTHAEAFKCQQQTASGCPPSPPSGGLVPAFQVSDKTFGCDWTCGTSDADVILITFGINNPSNSGRKLYGFMYTLMVMNDVGTQTVTSVTVTDATINTEFRTVTPSQFAVVTEVPSGGGYTASTSFIVFPMLPGEELDLTFTVPFQFSLASAYTFQLTVTPFEPCTPYYYGTPSTCSPASEGSKIARSAVTSGSPLVLSFGSGGQCSDQCSPTTPAPGSPGSAPTPPTPPPTPPPVAASSGTRTDSKMIEASLLSCAYDCNDPRDGRKNELVFTVTETLLVLSEPASMGGAYQFSLTITSAANGPETFNPALAYAAAPFVSGNANTYATPTSDVVRGAITTTASTSPTALTAFGVASADESVLPAATPQYGYQASFNVTFLFSSATYPSDFISGSLQVTYYEQNYHCTLTSVQLGICTAAQDGQFVNLALALPEIDFTYGDASTTTYADDTCSQLCPPVPFNVPLPDPATLTLSTNCQFGCGPNDPPEAKNRYIFRACVTNLWVPGSAGASSIAINTFLFSINYELFFPNGSFQAYVNLPEGTGFDGFSFLATSVSGQFAPVMPVYIGAGQTWRVPVQYIFIDPGATECVDITFYRNDFIPQDDIQMSYSIFYGWACSTLQFESGSCSLDMQEPFIAASEGYDAPYITAVFLKGLQGFTTVVNPALGNTSFVCTGLCAIGTNFSNPGGFAFFDNNFDGTYDGNDTLIQGLTIHAYTSSSLLDTAVTVTDANGVYGFSYSQLNGTNTNLYFFQVDLGDVPTGARVTKLGTLNPYLDNIFSGSPPRSPTFQYNGNFPDMIVGFEPINAASCTPDNSPQGTTGELIIADTQSCSLCGTDSLLGQCTDLFCPPGSTVRRLVEVPFTVRNRGPSDQPPQTITVTLTQADGNFVDAMLLCSDVQSVANTNGTLVLETRPGVQTGSKAHPARITYGLLTLKAGATLSFTPLFAFCASSDAFAYNITVEVQNDFCTDLLVNYTNCVEPNIDFRQCYSQQSSVVSSMPCATTCPPTAPTPTSRTLKPPRTSPPTPPTTSLGATGSYTLINSTIEFLRESRLCVTKQLLQPQQCDNFDDAVATCKAATNRGIYTTRFVFVRNATYPVGAGSTERAIVTLRVQRLMNDSTLFCRAMFDPEVRISATGHQTVASLLAVLSSEVIVAKEEMHVSLALNPINPGTTLYVDVRSIECVNVSEIAFAASVSVQSDTCFESAPCDESTLFNSTVNSPVIVEPCQPVDIDPEFASGGGPDNIKKVFSELDHSSTSVPGGFIAIVVIVCALLCCALLLCCLYFCVPMLRQRVEDRAVLRGSTPRTVTHTVNFGQRASGTGIHQRNLRE
jgi:hypothetical protein